jgi:VWFA-related protein
MQPSPLVALSLVLPAAVGFQAAQLPEAEHPPVLSVETSLVMLPITVVDRSGRFISGLTQADFTVYDNGELRPTEFFTSEDIPATVGLVIDCSGSMRALREHVTSAGAAFAEASHPLDELFTVNFNEHVWPGLPQGVNFARNPEELRTALTRAPAAGLTALYDALDFALDRLARGTRDRKVLIVVSDGGDNASRSTLASVRTKAQKMGAIIYAVALLDPDGRDAKPGDLKALASLTGGEAYRPTRVEDVGKAFNRVAREIRNGYMVGFSPPDAPGAGFHSLRVVVRAPDGRPLVARTRAGYSAGRAHQGPA